MEKCPVSPKAVKAVPQGMADREGSGIYHLRSRRSGDQPPTTAGALHGEQLLEEKKKMSVGDQEPAYQFNYNIQDELDEWQ